MGEIVGTVTDFEFSTANTDSEVTIMCKGNRIHIDISAENLQKSSTVQSQYLHFLQVAEAFELDGLTVDDFFAWILEGCAPKFLCLPQSNYCKNPTLESFIHPQTFYYKLHATEDDKFALLDQKTASTEHRSLRLNLSEELCSSWICFDPSQIQICADSPEQALSQTPRKVQTDGNRTHFFKSYRYCDSATARQELEKYLKIREAGLDGLAISRLFGLVRDRSGHVLGLLLSYIEANARTLTCAVKPDTPVSLRRRWAEQVTSTLSSLHRAGIIWGDAKPDNVLVDRQSNAWIIDFGGGYTEGWVEPDIADTVQGDLQGLSRITEYIFT